MCTREELAALLPDLPSGMRPKPRVAVKYLSPCLELVELGPDGSRRHARWRVVGHDLPDPAAPPSVDGLDDSWALSLLLRKDGRK